MGAFYANLSITTAEFLIFQAGFLIRERVRSTQTSVQRLPNFFPQVFSSWKSQAAFNY